MIVNARNYYCDDEGQPRCWILPDDSEEDRDSFSLGIATEIRREFGPDAQVIIIEGRAQDAVWFRAAARLITAAEPPGMTINK